MTFLFYELSNLLLAMAGVLAWAWLLQGVGTAIVRGLFPNRAMRTSLWDAAWWGILGTLAWLQALHTFFPIRWWAAVPMLGLALWKGRRPLPRIRWPETTVSLVILAWVLFICRQPITNADTGFYHLNLVRWQTEYALFRGFGHFNLQFAYNQTYFLLGSLLRLAPLDAPLRPFLNPLLWWLVLNPLVVQAGHFLRNPSRGMNLRDAFALAAIPAWLLLMYYLRLHDPTSDIMPFVIGMKLMELCFILIHRKRGQDPAFLLAMALACWLPLTKMTGLGDALGALAVLGFLLLRNRRLPSLKPALIIATVILMSCAFWFYRGYVNSGILGFPLSASESLPRAQWAMVGARETSEGHHALIRMTFDREICSRIDKQRGRNDGGEFLETDLDFSDPSEPWNRAELWVIPALHDAWNEPLAPFTVFWLVLMMLWIAFDLCRRKRPRFLYAAVFMIPVGHVVLLLFASPFFRYTEAGIWGILILTMIFRLQRLCANGGSTAGKVFLGLWCGSLISFLAIIAEDDRSLLPTMAWWAPPPIPDTTTVTTEGGITYEFSAPKIRSYDPPIPSGRAFNPNLHYLDPEKGLKGGVYAKPQD